MDLASGSCFDRFLDEIIYFFETNPIDTVIFEDLDRFDDPLVYTGLRDLNLILNNAPGVLARRRRKGGRVRFVYAMRDSVFDEEAFVITDEMDSASGRDARVPGSNRVKFFDAVVPVMPFITSVNAYEVISPLFRDLLKEDASWKALRIIAPYLTDMRLAKEMKNEFAMMREVLMTSCRSISGHGGQLGITDDGVLAMAAYKCVRPTDFEAIASGKSDLDRVYDLYQEMIGSYIAANQRGKSRVSGLDGDKIGKYDRIGDGALFFDGVGYGEAWGFPLDPEEYERAGTLTFGLEVTRIVGNEMCCRLIQQDFIQQDFALYSASYPPSGRPRALNYFIHHLRRDIPNLWYELDDEDARELIELNCDSGWCRQGSFNVYLLSYALLNREDVAKSIMSAAVADYSDNDVYFGDPDGSALLDGFIVTHLEEKEDEVLLRFVKVLVSIWEGALDYLLVSAPFAYVPPELVIDEILCSMIPTINYSVVKSEAFIRNILSGSAFLRRNEWEEWESRALVVLSEKCGFQFEDVSQLHGSLRETVINSGCFTLTRHNIFCILPEGRRSMPELVELSDVSKALYDRITRDYSSFLEYVHVLKDDEFIFRSRSGQEVGNLLLTLARGAGMVDTAKMRECAIEISRRNGGLSADSRQVRKRREASEDGSSS